MAKVFTPGLRLLISAVLVAAPLMAQDVLTYHNDNARTGQNLNETILTPANVNSTSFGKLFVLPADGLVDAEPLYLAGVIINSVSHNVVFVETENDSVYAYDADTGALLWQVSILSNNETPSDDRGCGQVTPEIGITATPVIDPSSGPHGTIYLVAMTKDSLGNYHHRLHALDVTTGAEEFSGPMEITATYPGSGDEGNGTTLTFNPAQHKARAGLLLLNNTVYLGFSSHCDDPPYNGWIMGYSETTLAQTQLLNFTPNGSDGSVWQSGAGLAADTGGNIYFLAANGTADTALNLGGFPVMGDYGNAFLKLSTSGSLAVSDYFNEDNTVSESNADEDLGSGGALVLPDLKDGNGTTWHLAVGAGKDGNIYLVNRDNMGKFSQSADNIYQQLNGALSGGEWGMPAYFNNAIYYGSVGNNLQMFPLANAMLQTVPSSVTNTNFGYPGATPSISANGSADGIVWAVENNDTAVLHAYDATNLANELYNSNQAANGRDRFGSGNKYITPMIANGKVYVGTASGVGVLGLLSTTARLSKTSLTFAAQLEETTSPSQSVNLVNQTAVDLTGVSVSTTGDFGQTNNCGTVLAGKQRCTINVTFSPLSSGTLTGTLSVSDSASNSPQTAGLTGTGTAPAPVAKLSTKSLSFSPQPAMTNSAAKSVLLTNKGTGALLISGISATGDFAVGTGTDPCGASLAGGASCYVYVTFTPASRGVFSGTLSIADNAPASPQTVSLEGTGTDFAIAASPSSRAIPASGSKAFTVTISPEDGFTGTVAIGCSGAPVTMTCTSVPKSVTVSGAGVTATVTVKTAGTSNGTYTLTLTGTAGALDHATTVSAVVN